MKIRNISNQVLGLVTIGDNGAYSQTNLRVNTEEEVESLWSQLYRLCDPELGLLQVIETSDEEDPVEKSYIAPNGTDYYSDTALETKAGTLDTDTEAVPVEGETYYKVVISDIDYYVSGEDVEEQEESNNSGEGN